MSRDGFMFSFNNECNKVVHHALYEWLNSERLTAGLMVLPFYRYCILLIGYN